MGTLVFFLAYFFTPELNFPKFMLPPPAPELYFPKLMLPPPALGTIGAFMYYSGLTLLYCALIYFG